MTAKDVHLIIKSNPYMYNYARLSDIFEAREKGRIAKKKKNASIQIQCIRRCCIVTAHISK